jgi:hypothetical protein
VYVARRLAAHLAGNLAINVSTEDRELERT